MGRAARFHEADVRRLAAAAQKANVRDYRVDVRPDGTLSLVVGSAARASSGPDTCADLLD